MTKLQALSEAISDAIASKNRESVEDTGQHIWDWQIKALEALEDDIILFLDKKITADELYKRLEK
jgi:hypothetical protein